MWAWYFFSSGMSSKKNCDEPVHHKQLISSVWKLMPNPVQLLLMITIIWEKLSDPTRSLSKTPMQMRDKKTGCIFVAFLTRKTEGKDLRSSIKEARNHKYFTSTSLHHHSVSNLTNLLKKLWKWSFSFRNSVLFTKCHTYLKILAY